MKKEFVYEAPQVEIIEVAVEKGYATTGGAYSIEVANDEVEVDGNDKWWCL